MPKESSPQIHIKNNNENWTTRKLGNILKPNTEKNRDHKFNLVESVSNKYGLVKQTDQFKDYEVASKDTHNYYVIRPTTFVYNPSRINVRSIGYKKKPETLFQLFLPSMCRFRLTVILMTASYGYGCILLNLIMNVVFLARAVFVPLSPTSNFVWRILRILI